MQVVARAAGPVSVLELSGRFDTYAAPAVAAWLEKASTAIPPYVVVDLSGVNFVDSTALATLVRELMRCRKRDGDLYLCGLQRQVYMIFELSRLDRAFSIFVDKDHAIKSFTS